MHHGWCGTAAEGSTGAGCGARRGLGCGLTLGLGVRLRPGVPAERSGDEVLEGGSRDMPLAAGRVVVVPA